MAFKKESLAKLLVRLKIAEDDAKAIALIDAQEEKELAIPDTIKLYTTDEFATATANIKNEGIKIGKEIMVKDLKEKAGLDYEGKDPDKFLAEYKGHVQKESNISVDDKVKDRDKTIGELKSALKKAQDDHGAELSKGKELMQDFGLLRMLPKDRDDRFSDDQWLTLAKAELQFAEEDGKPIVKDRQGNVLKDAQFNPVSYESAISDLFKSKKWVKEQQQESAKGQGFDSSKHVPGAINNMREFKKYAQDQGWDLKGQEAQAKLAEVTKANTNFNFAEN